jgi:uncharacterized iron-regulated membrane protein
LSRKRNCDHIKLSPSTIRTLYGIHKWVGLAAALPLCLILLTGAISVFHDELDAWVTPGRLVPTGPPKATLTQISSIVTHTFPGSRLFGLVFPPRPGVAITAYLSQPAEVLVDPRSGAVTGTRVGDSFPTFLRTLHVRFNIRLWWARVIVGCFGLALILSSITGAFLYLPFMRGVFAMGLPFWKLRRSGEPHLLWADLHRLIGIASLLFNLVMGTTGTVFGMLPLLRFAPGVERQLHPAPRPMQSPSKGPTIGPDEAMAIAERTWPGILPASILMPSAAAPRYTIYVNFPGGFMRGAASFLVIHAQSGEVLERYDARSERPAIYAYNWVEPLHYGAYGGLVLKWIYFVLGVCAAALTITGPMTQLLKSRRRL